MSLDMTLKKLNIDIPLYSFGGAIRVKSARCVCFVVRAMNLMNNKCYKISCLIYRKTHLKVNILKRVANF